MARMYCVREGSFQLEKKESLWIFCLERGVTKRRKERGREKEMNSPLFHLKSCSAFSIPQATVQGRQEGGELGMRIHSKEQVWPREPLCGQGLVITFHRSLATHKFLHGVCGDIMSGSS